MKNLKRALSLALASVMVLGMMVVGAGAVEFNDADKIENVDAVNSLVALGILKGKDNGSFDPEGIVTRAEMAKMICVALNGGKDPNLTGGTLFPDTKTHWAGGYIDYCANQGIVSGDTTGNFNPDKTVTGTEAAKMILIAIGYNAESEKFVNDAAWATNINVLANQKGLFEDVVGLPNIGLTRDYAAQMIWNGLDAKMVKYTMVGIINGNAVSQAEDFEDGRTILSNRFDMKTEYAYLTGVGYDADKAEFEYTLDDAANFNAPAITVDEYTGANIKSTKDFSALYGQKVKIMYKVSNSKITLYGLTASDSTVMVSDIAGNIGTVKTADTSVKIDGTSYKLTKTVGTTPVFAYNNGATGDDLADTLTKTQKIDLIDNTGDGKGDVIVIHPILVAKVTFVGKDSITAGNVSYKYEDADIYEDVKKDDYAVITPADNTAKDMAVITKAEVITGKIDALKGTTEAKVDGVWYEDVAAHAGDAYKLGDTFELTVVNGYVYNAKKTTSTASVENVAYLMKADAPGEGTKLGTQTARLLFADGTKKIVTVDKTDMRAAGTMEDILLNTNQLALGGGVMYTYATDKDGNYELSQMKNADFDGVKNTANTDAGGGTAISIADGKATGGTGTSGTFRFADNAVVFVLDTAGTVKALSGATINKWGSTTYATASIDTDVDPDDIDVSSVLYANTSNGFMTVAMGVLNVNHSSVPGATGDTKYGWLTKDSSLVKDGDDYYVEMTLWNGSEEVTVLAEGITAGNTSIGSSTSVAAYDKGQPISYKDLGGDKISTATVLTTADAVTGYAGGSDISFETATSTEIDDDTIIIYVDTAKNEGVEGASVTVADKDILGNYIKNVYAGDNGNKVAYIIVDISNNLDENTSDKDITELKHDVSGTPTSMVGAISVAEKTININGKTVTGMLEVVADGETTFVSTAAFAISAGADYTVVKTGSSTSTALEVGDVVRIVAADGSFVNYTVIDQT